EQVMELRDLVQKQKGFMAKLAPDWDAIKDKTPLVRTNLKKFKKEVKLKDKNLERLDKRIEKVQTRRENLEAKMESKFEKQLNSQEAIIGVLTNLHKEVKPAEAKQIIALIQSKKLSITANSQALIQGDGGELNEKIQKINESAKTMTVTEKRVFKTAINKFMERKGDRLAKFEAVRGNIHNLRETKAELDNLKNLKVGDKVKLDKDMIKEYEKGEYQVVGVDKEDVFLLRPKLNHDFADVIKMTLPKGQDGLKYEETKDNDWSKDYLKTQKEAILKYYPNELKKIQDTMKYEDKPGNQTTENINKRKIEHKAEFENAQKLLENYKKILKNSNPKNDSEEYKIIDNLQKCFDIKTFTLNP
nr:hypothetical protein [Candidatus Gracilibacteria bacterium]